MSEYDNNEFDVDPEQVEEALEANAKPLCPNCLCECNELSYYCEHCNAFNPINPLAAYMPFVRLWMICGLYSTAWRKVWYDKNISDTFRIFLTFFICFYIPLIAVVGLLVLFLRKDSTPEISTELQRSITTTMAFLILLRILPALFSIISVFRY